MNRILTASGLLAFTLALVAACGSSSSKQAQRDDGGAGGEEPAVGGAAASGGGGSAAMMDNSGGAGEAADVTGGAGGVGGDVTGGAGGVGGDATGAGGDAAGAGGAPSIASLKVFNTGVDDNGTPLAGGSVDPHYTLIESADTTFTGPDAIVVSSIAEGYWLADSDTSKWLAPSANQVYPSPTPCNAAGTYVYRTTFSLTESEATTFKITGGWAADNSGTDILLNDVSLGITAGSYASLSTFSIESGFVAGANTLDFELLDSGCPNGLRVELTALAQ